MHLMEPHQSPPESSSMYSSSAAEIRTKAELAQKHAAKPSTVEPT